MALFSPEVMIGFLLGSLILTFIFQAAFIVTGAFGYVKERPKHPELKGVKKGEPLLVVKFDPTDKEVDMMHELQQRIDELKGELDDETEEDRG
jgi:hypothetical protein